MSYPPLPPYEDIDAWVRYYRKYWGINTVPAPSQEKGKKAKERKLKWILWEEYQSKPITDEQQEAWIAEGRYRKVQGIGLLAGKVWFGPNAGKYLIEADADNQLGINLILELFDCKTLQDLCALGIVVEQHYEDAPHKCHFYLYAFIPMQALSGIKNRVAPGTDVKKLVEENKIPANEIKSETGLTFGSPGLHVGGKRYKHLPTSTPVPFLCLTETQVREKEQKLQQLLVKYGASYTGGGYGSGTDGNGNGNGSGKPRRTPTTDVLLQPDYRVFAGNDRHTDCLVMGDYYLRHYWSLGEGKREEPACLDMLNWNLQHCVPPLDRDELIELFYSRCVPFMERQAAREFKAIADRTITVGTWSTNDEDEDESSVEGNVSSSNIGAEPTEEEPSKENEEDREVQEEKVTIEESLNDPSVVTVSFGDRSLRVDLKYVKWHEQFKKKAGDIAPSRDVLKETVKALYAYIQKKTSEKLDCFPKKQENKSNENDTGRDNTSATATDTIDSFEEWQRKVQEKLEEYKYTAEYNFPGSWLGIEFVFSGKMILHIEDITLPFGGFLLGPPAGKKTLCVNQPKDTRHTFYLDSHTPNSWVSHYSAGTEEDEEKREERDLLPKIENKLYGTGELAPLLNQKEETLLQELGIITRLMDGQGYRSASGVMGVRGYDRPIMFVWIGAAVKIPYNVHKMLGQLGPKLYFFRMPEIETTEQEYITLLQGNDHREREATVKKAMMEYMDVFEKCPLFVKYNNLGGLEKIKWDKERDDKSVYSVIVKLSILLRSLRGVVQTRETDKGAGYGQGVNYAYYSAIREVPTRAQQQLYNVARGHALFSGRNYVTRDDLPMVVKMVLSSAADEQRVKALDVLLQTRKGSWITQADLAKKMNTSPHPAGRVMAEFRALELADVDGIYNDNPNQNRPKMRLKKEFYWFYSKEFQDLREGYTPTGGPQKPKRERKSRSNTKPNTSDKNGNGGGSEEIRPKEAQIEEIEKPKVNITSTPSNHIFSDPEKVTDIEQAQAPVPTISGSLGTESVTEEKSSDRGGELYSLLSSSGTFSLVKNDQQLAKTGVFGPQISLEKLHPVCKSLIMWDSEYTQDSNHDVYLWAFVDTLGQRGAWHVSDFPTPKDFANAINKKIESYDYSCTWWGRGRKEHQADDLDDDVDEDINNNNNNEASDLLVWHDFCKRVKADYNIVELESDYDSWPTIRSQHNPKHRHLDAHSMHNQTFIKSGVFKGALRSMSLEDVYLAVFPERKKGKLPGVDGSNVNKQPVEVQRAYCLRDAEMLAELMTKDNGQLLGVMDTISNYIGKDLEYVCHASDMTYLVTPMLDKMGYPSQRPDLEKPWKIQHWWNDEYKGGLVQPPLRGRHYNVRGADCVGMYPEIVMRHNISSETIACTCCQNDPKARERALTGDSELDNKGYWICNKQGLFPKFMQGLKEKRKEFKDLRDAAGDSGDTEAYRQYDTAQLAIKIYMNSSYGAFGFRKFQYADKRVAELITAFGRRFASGAKDLAESDKYGFVCIYGDTDGLLLKGGSTRSYETSFDSRFDEFLKECYQRFNLLIDNDRNFLEVTPVEKKQYLGIDAKTKKVIVKGLEGKKRGQCRFINDEFTRFIANYEKGLDPIPDVQAGLHRLDSGQLSPEDLVIKIQLKRKPSKYKQQNSVQAKIGKKLKRKKGEMIEYYKTGIDGDAASIHFKDASLEKYKEMHLTAIGKPLYAMGYDVDSIYGKEFGASKELKRRHEKNDNKKKKLIQNVKKVSPKNETLNTEVNIKRVWAMPSPRPFQIPVIAKLIEEECAGIPKEKIVDLFPYNATRDAFDLLKSLPDSSVSVFLIDPPYSHSQIKELYKDHGKEHRIKLVSWESPRPYWTAFRKEIARVLEPGGKCITLAWNSQGTGKGLGFEITRILQVAHGGGRNDTIVTVDRKVIQDLTKSPTFTPENE
jgi:hypothetical protein